MIYDNTALRHDVENNVFLDQKFPITSFVKRVELSCSNWNGTLEISLNQLMHSEPKEMYLQVFSFLLLHMYCIAQCARLASHTKELHCFSLFSYMHKRSRLDAEKMFFIKSKKCFINERPFQQKANLGIVLSKSSSTLPVFIHLLPCILSQGYERLSWSLESCSAHEAQIGHYLFGLWLKYSKSLHHFHLLLCLSPYW